jgi:hypothetical protein
MSLSNLTSPAAVRAALQEFDDLGRAVFLDKYGYRPARDYFLLATGKRYDSKAIAGVAYGYQHKQEGPLKAKDFSGGDATVSRKLTQLGFAVEGPDSGIGAERSRRQVMLDALRETDGLTEIPPQRLRDIGVYGGAQGVWVDQKQTGPLTPDGAGVAVGVLHTGQSYADDLTDDGLIYHYPTTNRGRKDEREIQALKFAKVYRLPIFVILHSTKRALRDVRQGWIIDHNDAAKQCLITFSEPQITTSTSLDVSPFRLKANHAEKQKTVAQRERSPLFRFDVLKRYGSKCAFCDVSVERLLDAAHIRPVKESGSDDPRNGLVLCANHHRAYDARLIGIEPSSCRLVSSKAGPTLASLGVLERTIEGLPTKPHPTALQWWWVKFGKGLD